MTRFAVDTRCPGCLRDNPLSSNATGEKAPTAGDVAVCWGCYAPSFFELSPLGLLSLRPPTAAEELELGRDQDLARTLTAMKSSPTPSIAVARVRREGGRPS